MATATSTSTVTYVGSYSRFGITDGTSHKEFPDRAVYVGSTPAIFSFTATGSEVSGSSLAITGDDASQYFSHVVSAGTSLAITVYFDPTSTGYKSAYLGVNSDDTDEPSVHAELLGFAHRYPEAGFESFVGGREFGIEESISVLVGSTPVKVDVHVEFNPTVRPVSGLARGRD